MTGCYGLLWVVMGCYGLLWVVMGCYGLLWAGLVCTSDVADETPWGELGGRRSIQKKKRTLPVVSHVVASSRSPQASHYHV